MDSCGADDANLAPDDSDGTVEIADGESAEPRDEHNRGGESDHATEERELEDVETEVQTELRVGAAELRAVEVLQHDRPAAGGRNSRENTQNGGDSHHRQTAEGLDRLLIAIQLRVQFRVDGPHSEGDLNAQPDGEGHGHKPDQEHHHGCCPSGGQNAEKAELIEPEHIGVEA